MTNEEALEVIEKNLSVAIQDDDGLNPEYDKEQVNALTIAKESIEKQIPQKPKITLHGTTGWNTVCHCTSCGGLLAESDKFCHKCGQALDWGTNNDKR